MAAEHPIGLCLAAYGGTDLGTALAAAAAAGVDVVDLPTDSTAGLVPPGAAAGPIAAAVAAAGLVVHCVSNSRDAQLLLGPHGPHTDGVLAGPPEAKREHGLRAALATVVLAAELGSPYARLQLGCPDHARWLSWPGSRVSWADNVAELVRRAAPVFDAAAASGVVVLLEPHPKQVAYDPASAAAVLAATAGWPGTVQLCLDPANLAAVGHDPVAAVRGWAGAIGSVHVKDLERWTGRDEPTGAGWSRYGPQPAIRFRALGAGELPWPRILAALADEGYTGAVCVEHEDALLPRRQSVQVAVDRLRALLPAAAPEGRTW